MVVDIRGKEGPVEPREKMMTAPNAPNLILRMNESTVEWNGVCDYHEYYVEDVDTGRVHSVGPEGMPSAKSASAFWLPYADEDRIVFVYENNIYIKYISKEGVETKQ